MKKQIITIAAVVVAFAAAIAIYVSVVDAQRTEKCREYEQILGGYMYNGYDSVQTTDHGKVSYNYNLELNADGTCQIHFKATRTGDTSRFPDNGTTEFDLTGMHWYVRYSDGGYEIYIAGGEWKWPGWSAAQIERTISIRDYGEEGMLLKAARNRHYEFYFRKTA